MKTVPQINPDTCTMCMKCISICPHEILAAENGAISVKADDCMLCAHCYAVCPTASIVFNPEVLREVSPRKEWTSHQHGHPGIAPDELWNFFTARRSIRRYTEEPVPDGLLAHCVDFAITAPSGSNCQLWHFKVINGRDRVWALALQIRDFFVSINKLASNTFIRIASIPFMGRKLLDYYREHYESVNRAIEESKNGKDLLFHGAPAVIIVHSPMEGSTPLEDGILSSYNIVLMAHALGLGTCYIGYAVEAINRSAALKAYLLIPPSHRVHAVLIAGYPAITFARSALRKPYGLSSG